MGLGFTIYGLTGFNLVGVTNYLSKPSDLCFVHLSTSATRKTVSSGDVIFSSRAIQYQIH